MISLDELYARDGGVCRIGIHPISREEASRDHIRPKARGGGDEPGNIQLACVPCNVSKGSDYEGLPSLSPVHRKKLKVPKSPWDFMPLWGPVSSPSRSVL